MTGEPTSRAKRKSREEHTSPAETQRRVQHIMRMMATGQWITGHSHLELAEKWGISASRVANLAGEASRWLVDHGSSDAELIAMMKSTLATITKICMSKGDMRLAIEAVKPMAQLVNAANSERQSAEKAMIEFLDPDGERVG